MLHTIDDSIAGRSVPPLSDARGGAFVCLLQDGRDVNDGQSKGEDQPEHKYSNSE